MVTLILILFIIVFIEHRFSPRFDYTLENWIILWYGPPSNRQYIKLIKL